MSKFSGLRTAKIAIREKPANQSFDISATQKPESLEVETAKKPGRPRAKRSDPAFVQVTAYIRQATHSEAKKRLIDDRREFSQLLEELISNWLHEAR